MGKRSVGKGAKDRLRIIRYLTKRDGYVCAEDGCMIEHDLTVDHRLARGLGGENTYENMQLMCSAHNNDKSYGESKACEAWRNWAKSPSRLEYERELLWEKALTSAA